MAWSFWEEDLPRVERHQVPERAPFKALDLIDEWARSAAAAEAALAEGGEDKASRIMKYTLRTLRDMNATIAKDDIDFVFGLCDKSGPGNVLALATITVRNYRVNSYPAVEITHVVKVPSGDQHRGVGAEFVRRIINWGGSVGRVVTLTPANLKLFFYYRKIGFRSITPLGKSMFYSGAGLYARSPDKWLGLFRIVTLEM